MKKYLLLLLIITQFAFGQTNLTTVTAGQYKMNIPTVGAVSDSAVVWNGTSKFMKIIPVSQIKGTTNLTFTATPTGGTVFSSTGTDAFLSLVTTVNAGLQSPADKVKLNGIATGATANQTDAYLLSRFNHTDTQAISTVLGLQPALDLKEDLVNKATSLTTVNNTLYPSTQAVSEGTAYKRTIAQIRALSGTLPNTNFYTTDIGQEGNWYYDSTDVVSADNTGTILVTSDGKRIKRIITGDILSSWFGFVSDLVLDINNAYVSGTDNAAKLTELLKLTGNLKIVKGNYFFNTNSFRVKSNTTLNLDGSVLKYKATSIFAPFFLIGGETFLSENITLMNGKIYGNKNELVTVTEHMHGVYIRQAKNVTLKNLESNLNKGDGMYIGMDTEVEANRNRSIIVDNCIFDKNHRQGVSVVSGSYISFLNCRFTNTAGTAPQFGVDIEPNDYVSAFRDLCHYITFDNCDFEGNIGGGLSFAGIYANTDDISNVDVLNSRFNNNGAGEIDIISCKNIKIDNCNIKTSANGNGIVFEDAIYKSVSVLNTKIEGGRGLVKNGIYIVQPVTATVAEGVIIDNCEIFNFGNYGFLNDTKGSTYLKGFKFTNNTIRNCFNNAKTNTGIINAVYYGNKSFDVGKDSDNVTYSGWTFGWTFSKADQLVTRIDLDITTTFDTKSHLFIDDLNATTVKITGGTDTQSLLANGTTLTNPISGTGTIGNIPKITGTRILGDSQLWDNGPNLGYGINPAISKFHVFENSTSINALAGLTIEQAGTGDAVTHYLLSGVQRWTMGVDNSDSDKFKIGTGTSGLGTADKFTLDTSGNSVFSGSTTATSLIKSGATSTNVLLAGGTDVASNTLIAKGSLIASLTSSGNADQILTTTAATLIFDTNDNTPYGTISRTSNTFTVSAGGDGLYMFNVQPQVTENAVMNITTIWCQKNGVNVNNSGIINSSTGIGDTRVIPLVITVDLVAGDNITFMGITSAVNGSTLDFTTTSSPKPSTPSVIIDIKGWKK